MTFRDFGKGVKEKEYALLLGMTRCHLSETLGLISKQLETEAEGRSACMKRRFCMAHFKTEN